MMKIVILREIFLMIRNFSIIKVFVVPKKKKKTQLGLYLEDHGLGKKQN